MGIIVMLQSIEAELHRDMTKPVGDGLDSSHHMPARQSNPSVHPNDGPTIQNGPTRSSPN